MSTYPLNGSLPQYARYIGEFVLSDMTVQYFYRVIAYDRHRLPLTNASDQVISAYGPSVLDGNHAISINWSPVIGASFFNVFKAASASVPNDESAGIWWNASATETEVLDVGYPCTTRNSFLNPGVNPIFKIQVPPPPQPIPDCSNPTSQQFPCPEPAPTANKAKASEIDYGLY